MDFFTKFLPSVGNGIANAASPVVNSLAHLFAPVGYFNPVKSLRFGGYVQGGPVYQPFFNPYNPYVHPQTIPMSLRDMVEMMPYRG